MRQISDGLAVKFDWGFLVSVGAHALFVALLIFGLPRPDPSSPKDEAVNVELVKPPEEKTPKPEEKPAEQAPPQPEAAAKQASAPPVPVLRPVIEFGDKDAGPRQADDGNAATAPETPPEKPLPQPDRPDPAAAAVAVPEPPVRLTEVKKLYSQGATGDIVATTAMAGLSRGERAGELCATELREQLRHAAPPYWPDLLPAYRLDTGTVMEVRHGAFRAGGQWYDLRLRCVIDAGATRVVSFAFDVGAPVPRGQWKRRGFPDS